MIIAIDLRAKRLRSCHSVGLDYEVLDSIPVDVVGVESDADPTFGTCIARDEVSLWVGADHGLVDSGGRPTGDGDSAIAVVVVEIPSEAPLAHRGAEVLVTFATGLDIYLRQGVENAEESFPAPGHVGHPPVVAAGRRVR